MSADTGVASAGRRFLRPGWVVGHLLVVVAVLVCCRLGWWQWDRTKDADGTLQNLAYAILWPAFGASFVYMWWRFLQLELLKDVSDEQEMDADLTAMLQQGAAADPAPAPADRSVAPDVTSEVTIDSTPVAAPADADADADADVVTPNAPERDPDDDAPAGHPPVFVGTVEDVADDEDPELAAYNRALAALAEEDRRAR